MASAGMEGADSLGLVAAGSTGVGQPLVANGRWRRGWSAEREGRDRGGCQGGGQERVWGCARLDLAADVGQRAWANGRWLRECGRSGAGHGRWSREVGQRVCASGRGVDGRRRGPAGLGQHRRGQTDVGQQTRVNVRWPTDAAPVALFGLEGSDSLRLFSRWQPPVGQRAQANRCWPARGLRVAGRQRSCNACGATPVGPQPLVNNCWATTVGQQPLAAGPGHGRWSTGVGKRVWASARGGGELGGTPGSQRMWTGVRRPTSVGNRLWANECGQSQAHRPPAGRPPGQ